MRIFPVFLCRKPDRFGLGQFAHAFIDPVKELFVARYTGQTLENRFELDRDVVHTINYARLVNSGNPDRNVEV